MESRPVPSQEPIQFVKVLSWSVFIIIIGASLLLSLFIANYASGMLLEKQKENSLLLAENVNHQIYTRFTLPTLIGFGRIALDKKEQFNRLDQVIRSTIHGFHVMDLKIYDGEFTTVYATDPEQVGDKTLAGSAVKRAYTDNRPRFEIVTKVSPLKALFSQQLKPGSAIIRGYYILRAERNLTNLEENPVMGILEYTQDITNDYMATTNLQRLIVATAGITGIVLSLIILLLLRKVDAVNLQRVQDKERLERELHQQEKLAGMGRMVAGIAHEIRNPLGIISSSAEFLLKRLKKEESPNVRLVDAIVEESKRLSRVMHDFLDYARPKQPRLDPVNLSQSLEQVTVFLEHEFRKNDIQIVKDYGDELNVSGDKDLLYRGIYNILSNSIQAMSEAGKTGTITISAQTDESGKVHLQITDSGPGFSDEVIDKLLDPFFTTKDDGTGLGLAIVNSILESHGAEFSLSCAPEGGAQADMIFPAPQD
ncbi:MAG: sensor histidine kinase [Desulfovibrio sp.]